jgi:hypothetical protein
MYERCTTIPSLRQIIEVCRLDDAMVGFASNPASHEGRR